MKLYRIVGLLFCCTPGVALACAGLVIESAWISRPPPGVDVAAGYFVARNNGTEAITIIGVSSDNFSSSMLHETMYDDGKALMRHVNGFEIAPARKYRAKPNGPHLMLSGARAPYSALKEVQLTFICADGTTLNVSAEMRRTTLNEHSQTTP